MKISGIYKIQSKIKPERVYIGSSVDIMTRWGHHLSLLRRNVHPNSKLQNHYNKYGEYDLMFSIIIGCDKKNIISNEQYFIDSYNPWFNNRMKAENNYGVRHSPSALRKIGAASRGNKYSLGFKHSEAFRNNARSRMIGNKYMLGKKHTEEWKAANSKRMSGENHPQFGKKVTEERLELMRQRDIGKKASPETKKKMSDSGKKAWALRKLLKTTVN